MGRVGGRVATAVFIFLVYILLVAWLVVLFCCIKSHSVFEICGTMQMLSGNPFHRPLKLRTIMSGKFLICARHRSPLLLHTLDWVTILTWNFVSAKIEFVIDDLKLAII